ncbi:MAG: hypothetical protein IJM68_03720, partial [Synergistaceae bacterium]|nr:hypothetical protein [Synergistaceae bacterium]
MRTRKLVIIAIFLLLFPSTSYSAAKLTKTPAVDNRARNIYALFTKANPRLEPVNAKKYAEIVIEASEKFKQDPYVIA